MGDFAPFAEADPGKLDTLIALNVGALTQLTRAYLPGMLARKRGRILNLASTAAFQPGPLMAVYYATKAYVLSLSEALAEYGVAAMRKGDAVAVPGLMNKMFASSVRVTPRPIVRRIMHRMQSARG